MLQKRFVVQGVGSERRTIGKAINQATAAIEEHWLCCLPEQIS